MHKELCLILLLELKSGKPRELVFVYFLYWLPLIRLWIVCLCVCVHACVHLFEPVEH